MRPPRRRRPVLAWVAAVVTALVCAAWILSLRRDVGTGRGPWLFGILGGGISVSYWDMSDVKFSRMRWFQFPETPVVYRWLPEVSARDPYGPPRYRFWLYVPLWVPLVVAAVLTLLAWRWKRRTPPGTCRSCGYDLTGNVSGRCPECGTPTNANAAPATAGRRESA